MMVSRFNARRLYFNESSIPNLTYFHRNVLSLVICNDVNLKHVKNEKRKISKGSGPQYL